MHLRAWLGLVALFAPACDAEPRPWPTLATRADASGVDAAGLPDASAAPVAGGNAYVCGCVLQVPAGCVSGDWCGLPTTGTGWTADGYCSLGMRRAVVCDPRAPGDGAPLTHADLQRDCRGRVQATVAAAARAVFQICRGGPGPCAVRFGCSAVRYDGTVETRAEPACDAPCAPVELRVVGQDWNAREATFVPAATQVDCGEGPRADTPSVCGRLF